MNRSEADEILAILDQREGEPDVRAWGEQYLELSRTLRKGTEREKAARLQKLYRRQTPGLPEERMISVLEDALLPALAAATQASVAALRARLHREQPAFGYTAQPRPEGSLPEVPERDGWNAAGAFRVFSGALVGGESFQSGADSQQSPDESSANVVVPAEDGVWFAYEDDDFHGMVVHESAVTKVLQPPKLIGAVWVEGASVPVLDLEVRGDATYQRAVAYDPNVLGRGFVFNLGGDGETEIHASFRGERAVCLWIGSRLS